MKLYQKRMNLHVYKFCMKPQANKLKLWANIQHVFFFYAIVCALFIHGVSEGRKCSAARTTDTRNGIIVVVVIHSISKKTFCVGYNINIPYYNGKKKLLFFLLRRRRILIMFLNKKKKKMIKNNTNNNKINSLSSSWVK